MGPVSVMSRRERRILGHAEVDQRDAAVRAQHDVAGLQIPVQHARAVHRGQGAGDRGGELQRLARRQPRPHPLAQVPALEVLHDEPGVLIADAQVVQPHHRGAGDALGDLVFLQEAPEGIERFLALPATVARDLDHHQRAGALALGQVQIRSRPAASGRMQR